jgi:flagellar motor switch/type III secretory pathway protein FliN
MSAGANTQPVAPEAAQVESSAQSSGNEELRWRPVLDLPAQLCVELPLPQFQVSDFLQLKIGTVVSTKWRLSRDAPLRVNGTLIGWCEFETIGRRLAVRVTELA